MSLHFICHYEDVTSVLSASVDDRYLDWKRRMRLVMRSASPLHHSFYVKLYAIDGQRYVPERNEKVLSGVFSAISSNLPLEDAAPPLVIEVFLSVRPDGSSVHSESRSPGSHPH